MVKYKIIEMVDGKVTFTKPVPPGCIFYGRVVAAQGYEREIEPLKIIKK